MFSWTVLLFTFYVMVGKVFNVESNVDYRW